MENFLYSVVGGGFAAILFKVIENYWVGFKLNENIAAKKKVKHYAKALWFDFHELSIRLTHIVEKIKSNTPANLDPLRYKMHNTDIEILTKERYYITSTAYLIASSSAWIRILQTEIVFLELSKSSLSSTFFSLIERFKRKVSSKSSILWYHYFNGIGENMINRETKTPIYYSDFIKKLAGDVEFRKFYDQLFRFLDALTHQGNTQNVAFLEELIQDLEELKQFLAENSSIPKINSEYRSTELRKMSAKDYE